MYSHADTVVDTDITSNTTWDTAGSPYIISNTIHVNSGATLTINPGVVVQFDDGKIYVSGSVLADGGAGSTIFFTSVSDTTIPGSSTDESYIGLTPAPGDYAGFVFYGGASATFSNVEMRYADTAITDYGANISIENANFNNSNIGILAYNGTFNLANNTFSHNTIPLQVNYRCDFTHSGNSFSDNIYDGIGMIDNFVGNYIYTAEESPYILFSTPQVLEGVTVTVSPGVSFQSDEMSNYISVIGGVLNAIGTPSNKIIFDGVPLQVVFGGTLTVHNADIKNISGTAVYVWNNGVADFDGVTIDSVSSDGIDVFSGGNLHLQNSTISHFGSVGIAAYDIAIATLLNSVIDTGFEGISAYNNASIDANHVTIEHCTNAGIISFGWGDYANSLIKLRNSTISTNDIGIYIVSHADVDISGNSIKNNAYGVYNGEGVTLDFSNNWWGDSSGPQNDTINPAGLGNTVSDQVIFDPWVTEDSSDPPPSPPPPPPEPVPTRNPVLIVPGVLGTEISQPILGGDPIRLWLDLVHTAADFLFGDTFMDPLQFNPDLTPTDTSLYLDGVMRSKTGSFAGISFPLFDYTSGLMESLNAQGYVENTDLFTFPYDWRYGVSEDIVTQLKDRITSILSATGSTSVDIIAHSTGGLLVKKYVVENPDNNHIDKAVFVGVPNTGAPKAVKALVQGDSFGIPFLSQTEMQRIARNVPVVYDLLPSQTYYDIKGSFIKIVNQHFFTSISHLLNFDQSNSYLTVDHSLNASALVNAHALHTPDFDNYDMRTAGVDLYAIDGCKTGTITRFVEVRADMPFGGTLVSYNAPTENTGDGTVPLESATNLPITASHKFYSLNADHAQMMSQSGIRQQIVNILTGSHLSTDDSAGHHLITQDIGLCELGGHAISVYSPLSIDVVDQNGNHAGLTSVGSIENTIPNADYEIMGEHKFVYLSNDEGRTYTISIHGTGSGTFTLTDATIVDGYVTQTQVFKNIPVTSVLSGAVLSSDNSTLSLDTNGDGNIDQVLHPSFVLDALQSEDFNPQETDAPDTGNGNSVYHSNGHAVSSVSNILPLAENLQQEVISEANNQQNQELAVSVLPILKNLEIQQQRESLKQDGGKTSILTASAASSGFPVNKKIVLTGIFGVAGLVLIRKKFVR